jgi:hypothetical protein
MCKVCLENCKKHLPDVPEERWFDFLMEFTCFPFGDAQMVEQQLITKVYGEFFRASGPI